MSLYTPAEFITGWLLSGPEYLRENAMFNAGLALNGLPEDRDSYLLDLEAWVGYHWNVGPHENPGSHILALRDRLTYDEIEGADWQQIAEALVAATPSDASS